MLKGYVVGKTQIRCPLCMSPDFTPYRKTPGINKAVTNQCRCEACGQYFEYDEDLEGNAIQTEASRRADVA